MENLTKRIAALAIVEAALPSRVRSYSSYSSPKTEAAAIAFARWRDETCHQLSDMGLGDEVDRLGWATRGDIWEQVSGARDFLTALSKHIQSDAGLATRIASKLEAKIAKAAAAIGKSVPASDEDADLDRVLIAIREREKADAVSLPPLREIIKATLGMSDEAAKKVGLRAHQRGLLADCTSGFSFGRLSERGRAAADELRGARQVIPVADALTRPIPTDALPAPNGPRSVPALDLWAAGWFGLGWLLAKFGAGAIGWMKVRAIMLLGPASDSAVRWAVVSSVIVAICVSAVALNLIANLIDREGAIAAVGRTPRARILVIVALAGTAVYLLVKI